MENTVLMKKGGQVRQVLKSKVGKMIDKGFVQVEKSKDKLLEVGGKEDLAGQLVVLEKANKSNVNLLAKRDATIIELNKKIASLTKKETK